MNTIHISQRVLCVTLAIFFLSLNVNAQDNFLDDFSDGDIEDGTPVTWVPGTPVWGGLFAAGQREVVDGNWVWTAEPDSFDGLMGANVTDFIFEDVSLHTQFRLSGSGRVSIDGRDGGYSAGMTDKGVISIFSYDKWLRDGEGVLVPPQHTGLDPINNDVHMQFDLFGDELTFTVWPHGDPTATTEIVAIDEAFTDGQVGLFLNSFDNAVVDFRFFEAKAMEDGLQAGDADQDLDFDQLDLVKVQIGAKYLTGQAATWGEGDWNGAPGGKRGNPPVGDGQFNQIDIITALSAEIYLTGPYAALKSGGFIDDSQTSLVYDATTGELSVDAPAGTNLTSINVTSASGSFVGDKPAVLDGAFDNFAGDNIFKATFGGSFGSISFGSVLPMGMSEGDVSVDLSAVGSLAGGGDLAEVDLVYIPEPTTAILLGIGLISVLGMVQRRKVA